MVAVVAVVAVAMLAVAFSEAAAAVGEMWCGCVRVAPRAGDVCRLRLKRWQCSAECLAACSKLPTVATVLKPSPALARQPDRCYGRAQPIGVLTCHITESDRVAAEMEPRRPRLSRLAERAHANFV